MKRAARTWQPLLLAGSMVAAPVTADVPASSLPRAAWLGVARVIVDCPAATALPNPSADELCRRVVAIARSRTTLPVVVGPPGPLDDPLRAASARDAMVLQVEVAATASSDTGAHALAVTLGLHRHALVQSAGDLPVRRFSVARGDRQALDRELQKTIGDLLSTPAAAELAPGRRGFHPPRQD